jgi:hypothetical protein
MFRELADYRKIVVRCIENVSPVFYCALALKLGHDEQSPVDDEVVAASEACLVINNTVTSLARFALIGEQFKLGHDVAVRLQAGSSTERRDETELN